MQVNDLKESPLAQDLERVLSLLPQGSLNRFNYSSSDVASNRTRASDDETMMTTLSFNSRSNSMVADHLAWASTETSMYSQTGRSPAYKGGSVISDSTIIASPIQEDVESDTKAGAFPFLSLVHLELFK